MYVAELCTRNVVTVRPDDEIALAARRMRETHVGYLVVLESGVPAGTIPRVIGVLTDRDIVVEVVAQDADPRHVLVRDVMTRQPVVLEGFATLPAAMQEMRRVSVRRMPVVGKQGELLGVLSLDDALDVLSGELASLAGAIRNERRVESMLRD